MKTDERNKFAIKSFLGEYLDLRKDKDNELATVDSIRKGVEFKGANLWILIFAIFMASLGLNVNSTAVIIGAIVGNTQAYSFGRWFGQKIYTKNFLFLKQDKLMRAKVFYDKHGGKTVFLGRFVPIIRAFVPIIAGAASMKSLRFEFYSMTGAVAWAVGLIGAGYLFGNIPIVRNNLTVILLIGVAGAFSGPIIIAWVLRMLHMRDARKGTPVTLPKD